MSEVGKGQHTACAMAWAILLNLLLCRHIVAMTTIAQTSASSFSVPAVNCPIFSLNTSGSINVFRMPLSMLTF